MLEALRRKVVRLGLATMLYRDFPACGSFLRVRYWPAKGAAVVVAIQIATAIHRRVSSSARVFRRGCCRLVRIRGCRACIEGMVLSCRSRCNATLELHTICTHIRCRDKSCPRANFNPSQLETTDARKQTRNLSHLQQTPTLPLPAVQTRNLRPLDLRSFVLIRVGGRLRASRLLWGICFHASSRSNASCRCLKPSGIVGTLTKRGDGNVGIGYC